MGGGRRRTRRHAAGGSVVHDFAVSNEGDAELEILEVIPACGCTAAASTGRRTRRIREDPRRFQHRELVGWWPHDWSSNDPQNPRFQLTLQADVTTFAHPGHARFIYAQARG
jgi:hypothetical protein